MSTEVQQLEAQLSQAKQVAAEKQMALKLSTNREFRQLILDEFCVKECARYAQLSADPSLPANERADSLALAQAAGHLRRWLSVKIQMGNVAEREIAEVEAAIEEARAEEEGAQQ
ncbi:hypothetical protein [Paraburkholderia sp. SIMBA_054]|uniref:hypothetical protein n=1 Tax=Paraburkholderia sp. SIMBA_054 TaxID=3085795 RepID=UPI00397DA17E